MYVINMRVLGKELEFVKKKLKKYFSFKKKNIIKKY